MGFILQALKYFVIFLCLAGCVCSGNIIVIVLLGRKKKKTASAKSLFLNTVTHVPSYILAFLKSLVLVPQAQPGFCATTQEQQVMLIKNKAESIWAQNAPAEGGRAPSPHSCFPH